MKQLHRRMYVIIVGTLLVFLLCAGIVWHATAGPLSAMWGVETATRLSASLLDAPHAPGADQQLVDTLGNQMGGDVVLFAPDGTSLNYHGRPFEFTAERMATPGWMFHEGPTYGARLADGRMLVAHPRQRLLLHGLHIGLIMCVIAALLAMLTYPIARGITGRLARLELGVQKFGDGDLGARVAVEGNDEVAALAIRFNDSASRVENLVRANQQLLANCSHELRTPLTRMRMAIEGGAGATLGIDRGEELKRNIAELDTLIGELLLASRLEAARAPGRIEPVDLLALAAEEAAWFDREVTGSAVTLSGDPVLLRRLLRNLLQNARVHAGGASEIRVEPEGSGARLVVEDQGPGIPPEDRQRIFEPFYRRSNATQSTGTGLGLSIVRQIARLHRGDAWVETREGGGSRFIATLPGLTP